MQILLTFLLFLTCLCSSGTFVGSAILAASPWMNASNDAIVKEVEINTPTTNTPEVEVTTDETSSFQPTTVAPVASTIEENDSWVDLIMAVAHLVMPYLSFELPGIDWSPVSSAVSSLRTVLGRIDITSNPTMTTAVGLATVAVPLIVQGTRVLSRTLLEFTENFLFVSTGYGISKRAESNNLMDDLLVAIQNVGDIEEL